MLILYCVNVVWFGGGAVVKLLQGDVVGKKVLLHLLNCLFASFIL